MPASRSPLFAATVRALLTAFTAAAIGAALLDVTLAALHTSDPLPATAFLQATLAAIGLYGVVALLGAIAVGVVAGSVRTVLQEGATKTLRDRLRSDHQFDLSAAAGLLAAGAAAGVLAVIVFVFARGFGLEMANKRNGALSTALVSAAALPIALAAWFPAFLVLRPATRLLPRPRLFIALGGVALLAALGVALAVFSVDWRIINFGPFFALAWFAAFASAHLWFWNRGPGVKLAQRLSPTLQLLGAAAPVAITAGLFLLLIARFGSEPRSLALVAEESAGARPILHAAQKLADRDHDGYAAILGGGDCNDRDPAINPAASDEPENGVDEDCSGADAKRSAARQVAAQSPNTPNPNTPSPTTPNPTAAPAFPKWEGNLLIITIDTLRADRLDDKRMPNLAAFAKDATVFTHAYAQAPNTPRSFPSFLTSRYPSQIHWQKESLNFSPFLDDNTTFFEALHEAGFHTAGAFSHFYLDPQNGVSQGFDEWDNTGALTLHDSNTDIAAPRITPKVIARLGQLAKQPKSAKPVALWTHYFEPHSKYMEHPEFPVHGSGFQALEEKYDGEVSFVDLHVKQVLDALAKTGLDKTTAVVIFADHGEAFGEHRFLGSQMFFHGETLYDEVLRVPLLVRVPGVAGRRVDEPVMLIDLGPTVLDLVQAKIPASFQGRSLAPAIFGQPLAAEPVYAELLPATSWQHSWRVLVEGKYKLVDKISENSIELYDVAVDPREQHNLALSSPSEARRMKQALRDTMIAVASTAAPGTPDHKSGGGAHAAR